MSVKKFETIIDQSLGREPADLVIRNVTLINTRTGRMDVTDIAVTGDRITGTYESYDNAKEVIDGTGLYAVAGFIDTHVHVESSLISPLEFDRCVLPKGTTTAMCDPHEIANVLGAEGLDYFVASSEAAAMDLYINLSSCVPATQLETSGAVLEAEDLLRYKGHPKVVALAEFMNIGGVLGKEENVLKKLDAFSDGPIDGHLPGISGHALNAMAACGIRNCHESTSLKEAWEKLDKGLHVFIREGTAAKNSDALAPLVNEFTSPHVSICTDDRNPLDIAEQGHLDYIIRNLIAKGADPMSVYRAATWSAAQDVGLHLDSPRGPRRGFIGPGWKADIVLLSDFKECRVHSVIKNGKLVTGDTFAARPDVAPVGLDSVKLKQVTAADFAIRSNNSDVDVIGIEAGSIVTKHLTATVTAKDGTLQRDFDRDLLTMAVLERHGKNGNIARAFVQGFGIKEGAIATSIGHDSHNVTVVGANDSDMAVAVNRISALGGGMVVVRNGVVEAELPLEIAGLMAKDRPYEVVKADLEALRHAAASLQPKMEEPFMLLAFLPLCVIPELKLTDFGLVRFNPAKGDMGPVLIGDQRPGKPQALRP